MSAYEFECVPCLYDIVDCGGSEHTFIGAKNACKRDFFLNLLYSADFQGWDCCCYSYTTENVWLLQNIALQNLEEIYA